MGKTRLQIEFYDHNQDGQNMLHRDTGNEPVTTVTCTGLL